MTTNTRLPRPAAATDVDPYDVSEWVKPPAWHDDAACAKDVPPDTWFADKDRATIAAAKAICATCPVAAKCLQAALERDEAWGVWGGVSFVDGEHRRLGGAA